MELASSAVGGGFAVLAVEVDGDGDDRDEDDGENPGGGLEPVEETGESAGEGVVVGEAGVIRRMSRGGKGEGRCNERRDPSQGRSSGCGECVHV